MRVPVDAPDRESTSNAEVEEPVGDEARPRLSWFHINRRTVSVASGGSANEDRNSNQLPDRVGENLTSDSQALMGVIKGNLGTGILSLPIALKYAGLLVGTILLPIIGIIATHCMKTLLRCARKLSARNNVAALDYGQVAQLSVAEGPRWVRTHGAAFQLLVNIFINVTQVGFCCVYVVFIAENMRDFINSFAPAPPSVTTSNTTHSGETLRSIYTLPLWCYEVAVVLLIAPCTFIRKMDALSWLAAVANLATVLGLCIIFAYCLVDLRPVSQLPAVGDLATLPLAFGIAVYSFEGNTLVLPIENQMRTPRAFGGWNGVLQTGMTVVVCLYTGVAFYGYLRFGDDIQSSITLSMPTDFWLYLALKPLFAAAIFISYLIQFYVPSMLLSRFIASNGLLLHHTTERVRTVIDTVLRLSLVAFTLLAAATIPHIDLMTSLVGGLSGTSLAFTFPALFEVFTFWNDPMYHDTHGLGLGHEHEHEQVPTGDSQVNSSRQRLVVRTPGLANKRAWWLLLTKNALIMSLGLCGFVTGTVTSIQQIVKAS